MRPFRILIVEDDEIWNETFLQNLETVPPFDLTGKDYERLDVSTVTNQEDATKAITTADKIGFDLVLLDLKYPLVPNGPLNEDKFQGMIWLPELRRAQPNAAIVILTAYAPETDVHDVVWAIKEHHADDFVPKTEGFDQIAARIHVACESARRAQQLILLEKEFFSLYRTRAARAQTFAEDIAALVGRMKASLFRVAQRIDSGDSSAIATAGASIRNEFSSFDKEFMELSDLLIKGQDQPEQVDVADMVRQLIRLYEKMIEASHAKANLPGEFQSAVLTTYKSDLKVALHEVITNALEALEDTSLLSTGSKTLDVSVIPAGENVTIRVADNGVGFSDEAIAHMFEPGYSNAGGRHNGLGLYIAQRMMHQTGGEIEVKNRQEGGTEISLLVRNLN